jgi:microcystin-dependent protein
MNALRRFLPWVLLLATAVPTFVAAQTVTIGGAPATIDYQGKALDTTGTPLANTTAANYTMYFRIYDAQEGGNIIWAESQIVTVSKGLFSVRLGEGSAIAGEGTVLQTNLADAFTAASRFLGVTVVITGQTPTEILPRLAFLATPFAYSANRSITAERLVLNPSATAVPSAVNASAVSYATQTLTGNATLDDANHTAAVSASAGSLTITLPAVTTRREYFILKTDASENVVTVVPPSGGNLYGFSPYSISSQFSGGGGSGGIRLKVRGEAVTVQNVSGNDWWVVSDTRDKTPVGTVIAVPGNAYGGWPAGYLYCNGASYTRSDTRYLDLFAVISTNSGTSNATSFNVPDLRGAFIRGQDGGRGLDPDRNSRTASNPGGSTGDAVGTYQAHALGSHNHTFTGSSSTTSADGVHNHMNKTNTATWSSDANYVANGAFGLVRVAQAGESYAGNTVSSGWFSSSSGGKIDGVTRAASIPNSDSHTHTVTPLGTIANTGSSETRPANVAMYYFIKY